MFSNEILPNFCSKFYCEKCDYGTSKKSSYVDHLMSAKHKKSMFSNEVLPKFCSKYVCNICCKEYKDNSGLWRHKKKCKIEEHTQNKSCNKNENEGETENEVKNTNEPTDKDLIMLLIKENSELKSMMMEVIKNGTTQNSNNVITTNSNNKAFNLNFFLNETCKDAINITDFVESIKLQLSDLERVGELGYVEGISNIIVKNLKELDVTQRPVHCTDKKRETIYVKDENKWEKDDENKKMHKMVRKVQDKNFKMIQKFKEKYPDYNKAASKHSDTYNNIIIESMGGRGDNDFEKEERIIKKVSKEVVVEK
jgi:Txe/YoeB family toxin of Txe-Axe toxin-antitoxin module